MIRCAGRAAGRYELATIGEAVHGVADTNGGTAMSLRGGW